MNKGLLVTIIVLVILVLAVGGYFLTRQTNSNSASNGQATGTENYNVEIRSFAFAPLTLTINKGETVAWINYDSAAHTVTSDSGNELNGGPLSQGQKYLHTFNTVGTFSYHCNFHPSMKATIVVK
jgi:plastocyanin